ncbi:uncharacterized protein PAC_07533 [Phialocephala subalpina]|uniref:Uncharacterized protein n=1 Tax=Phialocephala subalpina TaxID=576137 RepID=A0A1L7WY05_9HELO|nr:uncharacterized protein PAC_07533 [Phialocephala subalpina]
MFEKQHNLRAKEQSDAPNSSSSSELSDTPSSSPSAESSSGPASSSKAPKAKPQQYYWVKKDKEDKEKRRRERQEHGRTPTSPFPTPFSSAIYPTQKEKDCGNRSNHELGIFCSECKAMKMPWGNQIPYVAGHTTRAAEGTILAGVHLQDKTSIAVVSVVAFLIINHQSLESVQGLSAMLERYPAAAEAGRRVSHLVGALTYDADHADTEDEREIQAPLRQAFPWYSILNSILEQPWMTLAQFHERFTNESLDRRLPGKPSTNFNATTQATIFPPRARTPPVSLYPQNQPDDGNSGGGSGGAGGGDSGNGGGGKNSGSNGGGGTWGGSKGAGSNGTPDLGDGTSQQPQSSNAVERDRRHLEGDSDKADLIFKPQDIPEGTKAQAPAARGQWAMLEGTDTSNAVKGKINPTKYIMIRQDTANKDRIDVRVYPHIAGFNWHDKLDISTLNKEGKVVLHRKRVEILKKDQVGKVDRSKLCCKTQANKYGDIQKLLYDSLPHNKRKHESEDEAEEEAEEEMEGPMAKKQRGDGTRSVAFH